MPTPARLIPVLLALALLALPGCRAARRAAEPRAQTRISVIEQRIDAVVGQPLVIPVQIDGPINPKRPIAARLDDGRKIPAPLYWVSITPEPGGRPGNPTDGGGAGWLPAAGQWAVTPFSSATRPSATGAWVLVLDIPRDAIGQAVWIAGQRTILNWLPDPGHIQTRREAVPWRRPLGDEPVPSYLLRLIEPELLSPVHRWRYRLLTTGLEPEEVETLSRKARPPRAPGPPPFEEPVLEALARQNEARWQVALAMLWLADADLAERVKRRLVAAVDFGSGVVAPAWPTDQLELDTLLSDLLNPRLDPAQHVERASAWLDSLAPAAAWVIDDAGLRDALSGRSLGTCAVANLNDRATLAWATTADSPAAPDLIPLPAFTARTLVATRPPPSDAAQPKAQGAAVTLHAGRWETARVVALDPLPATPPGFRAEPLLGDWTMASWLRGTPDPQMAAPAEWATGALLYQRPAVPGGEPASWWLFLECRTPGAADETVRLWLGAMGSPAAVLRISSGGVVVDERAPDQGLGGSLSGAKVTRQAGKWVAQVPIPARAIESDGTLRLGIERTDGRGRRSAWPRPMLPWQTEPGRAAVNTRAWGSVDPARPASATR